MVSQISLPLRVFGQLTVHIGMDASAKAIFLEQCGKNRGYRDADIRGFRPEGGACLPDGPEVITSEVSMKAVCRRVNVEGTEVTFSRDAGRYVCPRGVGSQAGGEGGMAGGHGGKGVLDPVENVVCSPVQPFGGHGTGRIGVGGIPDHSHFFLLLHLPLPWQQASLMLWGCCIAPSAGSEAGPGSNNAAYCVVADMSVITPTTCLCITEMGAQRSSTSLRYHVGSPPAC